MRVLLAAWMTLGSGCAYFALPCVDDVDCPSDRVCASEVCVTGERVVDAGVDAGVADAGVADAGVVDAGAVLDAGPGLDAGSVCVAGTFPAEVGDLPHLVPCSGVNDTECVLVGDELDDLTIDTGGLWGVDGGVPTQEIDGISEADYPATSGRRPTWRRACASRRHPAAARPCSSTQRSAAWMS